MEILHYNRLSRLLSGNNVSLRSSTLLSMLPLMFPLVNIVLQCCHKSVESDKRSGFVSGTDLRQRNRRHTIADMVVDQRALYSHLSIIVREVLRLTLHLTVILLYTAQHKYVCTRLFAFLMF